jgi:hypothetical protein
MKIIESEVYNNNNNNKIIILLHCNVIFSLVEPQDSTGHHLGN